MVRDRLIFNLLFDKTIISCFYYDKYIKNQINCIYLEMKPSNKFKWRYL